MARRIADRTQQQMRRRVDALLGGVKPSARMIRGSIEPLLKKLEKQGRVGRARSAEFVRYLRSLERFQPRQPGARPEEVKAARALRASLIRRARLTKVNPPKIAPVPPQIRPGSILTISIPPYTARWTSGSGSSANHLLGNWSTASLNGGDSLAGVCLFFSPPPGRFLVRFAPYVPVNYSYDIETYTPYYAWTPSRAAASGFLGAFVSAWDGSQWVEIADARNTVWDRRVSIRDSDSGSDDTAWFSPQAEFMTLGEPFTFALWAWGGVSTSTQDGTWPGWGFANAVMSTSIPWIVIEQNI